MSSRLSQRMKIVLVTLLMIFELAGCSVFPNDELISFPVQSFGSSRVIEVRLQIIRESHSQIIDTVVSIANNEFTIIGTAMNVRVFTLKYDGINIMQGSGIGLPFGINPNLIINDLILILSDKELIRANLPIEWRLISDEPNTALLFKNDKLIVKYEKSLDSMGNNSVFLKRYSPSYEINALFSEVK